MADKKVYNEKTKTGWKRVKGKWQYYQNGRIVDTAMLSNTFTGAQDATRKWFKDTTNKAKDIRQQAIEREESYVPQVMSTHKTPITTALTEEVLPKTWDLTKRGAKNLKNAFSDIPKIGQGSGEFDDKGRELSIFELRRQKEKYKNNSSDESLKDESVVIPEAEDMYSIGLMAMTNSDPNSDWAKIWNIDYSKFPLEQKVSFKAAMEESYWLGGNDTYTNDTLDRLSSSINSAYTAAVSNPANSTTLGGMNTNDPTIRAETQKEVDNNIVSAVTGNTQANTPLVQTPSPTWGVNQQAETRAAELTKAEPKVTQWYDLEGEDGGEAAKQMARQKLADQKVEVKPEDIQTNQAVLQTGTLPESTFSSRFWDFLNNRGGGK